MNNNLESSSKLTIAIPAHNEEAKIADCIQSILDQNLDFPFEIIVINNASTDKTEEIVRKMNIKVINVPTKGLYYARSAGLNYAQSEFMIYLDADTRLKKGWIQQILTYLEKHQDVVAVSSNFKYYDADYIQGLILTILQWTVTPLTLLFLRLIGKPDFLIGSAFAIRTAALKKAGGFDEGFIFYGEDIATSYRISSQGKVRYLQNLFITTSARRFIRLGGITTTFLYMYVYICFIMGWKDTAIAFSKKHS